MRAYSPIRSLDDRESRRMVEDELHQARLRRQLKSQILEEENAALRMKLHHTANVNEADIHSLALRNSRLENELEQLNLRHQQINIAATTKEYHSTKIQRSLTEEIAFLTRQNQSLKLELTAKTAQLDSTLRQLHILEDKYNNEVVFLNAENKDLRARIAMGEREQVHEIQNIKRKYTTLHMDDSQAMRSTHTQQVRFLLQEIDKLRLALTDKSTELQLYFQDRRELKEQYDADLGIKISEINDLKNKLSVLQSQANRQIKDLTAKRELQRSRTNVIIDGSKESTSHLERQIKKLAGQISEKNKLLETLTKSYHAEKKKNEESQRNFNDMLTQVRKQNEEEQRQKMIQAEKRENILKEEILEKKKKQTELYMNIDKLQKQLEVAKHEYSILLSKFKDQENEIAQHKINNEKQRDEHMKQITKLMNDKMKRRSSRILSSQRSLNDSMKDSNLVEMPSGEQQVGPGHITSDLHQIKEEVYLRESNHSKENRSIMDVEGDEHDDYASLAAHYEQMMSELKKTHKVDMDAQSLELQKLKKSLVDKQNEIEDILNRFMPLVKIRAGQKSLEEDRKERIDRHWKADIALLEVLLEKYKIRIL